MYENLIETLRFCTKNGDCHDCPYEKPCAGTMGDGLYCEAADAIEERDRDAKEWEMLAELWQKACKRLENRMPHWIPVTERLPELNKVVTLTDGQDVGHGFLFDVRQSGTVMIWSTPFSDINEAHITHWMPLPDPPKEETR